MVKRYGRVLLKLSGESLAGQQGYGLDSSVLQEYAHAITTVAHQGTQIAIVVGGGNIFRGLQGVEAGFARAKGDQMGMLSTVINSMALAQWIEMEGGKAVVFTATPMMPIAQHYSLDGANASLERGEVVLLAGGTGNPYFTTDSAAALRAAELRCDALLKGTRVDGVYTADPEKDPKARKYARLTFADAYEKRLKIMDLTAFTLCQENHVPIVVFNMNGKGNLERLLAGEEMGTLVEN